jgi:hypothetical protein
MRMKPEDVLVVYLPTGTSQLRFAECGGADLPHVLPVIPIPGDEIAVGADVFRVIRRRIDPGPPCRVMLTLDHPAQGGLAR